MVPGREILLGGGKYPLHHPAATGAAQGLTGIPQGGWPAAALFALAGPARRVAP